MTTEQDPNTEPPAEAPAEADAPAAANPAPTAGQPGWVAPEEDAEFVVGDGGVNGAPDWVDKSWAAYADGPAIAVPMGNLYGSSPQHNTIAKKGDTVKFVAAKEGGAPAHFEVVAADPSSGFPHAAPADTYGAKPQGDWDPASQPAPAPEDTPAASQEPAPSA